MLSLPAQQAQLRGSPIGTNTLVTHTQVQRCSTPGAQVQYSSILSQIYYSFIHIAWMTEVWQQGPSNFRQCSQRAQTPQSQSRRDNPEGLVGPEHESGADALRAQALSPNTGRSSQGKSIQRFVVCMQNSVVLATWYGKQGYSRGAASEREAAWGTRRSGVAKYP